LTIWMIAGFYLQQVLKSSGGMTLSSNIHFDYDHCTTS
jgi:hypothetical protein